MDKLKITLKRAQTLFVPLKKEKEELDKKAQEFMNILTEKAEEASLDVGFRFGGSYAKGTWIKNESDIDIFVVFNSENEMKRLFLLAPKGFVPTFGTRKYFRGVFRGVKIEIVPVLRFLDAEKVANSIDLSVLHADYINSSLSAEQKKDVVILKAFCKANNCYGSETYMHGFSGYSLEVLIEKFGSFVSLMNAAKNWKEPVQLDKPVGDNKFPIFLADPTNQKRNICASVNDENLARLIFSIKRFYISPSFDFFVKKDVRKKVAGEIRTRNTRLFTFTTSITEPRDVFLSKYSKNAGKLIEELRRNDVEVYSYDFDYAETKATIFIQVGSVPKTKTRIMFGPSVFADVAVLNGFLKAHREVFVVDKKVSYDKEYNINDFNKFIFLKIKEYMSHKSILNG